MDDKTLTPSQNESGKDDLPEPMRRALLQIGAMVGGVLGVGAAIGPVARPRTASAAETDAEIRALENKLGLPKPEIEPKPVDQTACDMYRCADKIKRVSQRELSFKKLSEELGVSWIEQLIHNARRNLGRGRIGKDTPVADVTEARTALAFMFGARSWDELTELAGLGRENQGHLTWSPIYVPQQLADPEPDPDPVDLTKKIKKMGRMYGAGRVGVCEIDRRWIYTESCRNIVDPGEPETKPIVFRDIARPQETDDELIIPDAVKHAIVFTIPLSRAATQIAPASWMSDATTSHAQGQAALTEIALSEALRGFGYSAIPCKKGVGQSVPMAIDAGLGQLGLHGHLITPDYGSHVVIGKVLTDMPLIPDKPIDFGVTDYCAQCGLCAKSCPPSAIPDGIEKAIETLPAGARSVTIREAKPWYIEGIKCLSWWAEAGAVCRHCLDVCPYTQFSLIDFWGGAPPKTEAFWDLDLPNNGVEDKFARS